PPGSPDEDGDRYVEIWNLVFMQFEQEAGTIVRDLPKPSIDTGMGLERVSTVLQGVHTVFETTTMRALIEASADLTSADPASPSHKVIADHLRSTSFLLADGVLPSNEGRGYVLRRIMRRAMRHAHLLGASEPLMHRLVPALVTEMGQAYPEIGRAQPLIEETLEREETQFGRTLANGLRLLDEATGAMDEGASLDGETAFKLYDTYGFPYDLTEDALRSRGLTVDRDGFDAAMARQKAAARAAWKGSGQAADGELWFDIAEREGATEFTGYSSTEGEGRVVALIKDGVEVASAGAGDSVLVLTNQTPFYGESGGQTGDAGTITTPEGLRVAVTDTGKPLGRLHAHHARVEAGTLKTGDTVHLWVDAERRDRIRANHS
ncbi:MAG: alanine--tRNA ligase, partial [Proteobacteria bacterium]